MKHPSNPTKGYDRLEFLGDSVLKSVQSKYLFESYPEWGEGQLSRTRAQMENNEQLALWCRHLGLAPHIKCGQSIERDTTAWVHICSQVFEAYLGAIWIDCQYDFQRIYRLYMSWKLPVHENAITSYKNTLQEYLQKKFRAADFAGVDFLPTYDTILQEGPPHQPVFVVKCSIMTVEEGVPRKDKAAGRGSSLDLTWDLDDLLRDNNEKEEEGVLRGGIVRHEVTGRGATKKKAEAEAARKMLMRLGVL